jgi:hypothetical protein
LTDRKKQYNIRKGDNMKLKKTYSLLLVIFLCCSCVTINESWSEELTVRLFGHEFHLENIICKYDSERYINGDGYSIAVYEMPIELVNIIINTFDTIKETHPIKPDYRKEWTKEGWKETPYIEDEERFYKFASRALGGKNIHKSEEPLSYFKRLMNEKGNYYCYNYYLHDYTSTDLGISVGNIDFYVFSPKEKILILINCNT